MTHQNRSLQTAKATQRGLSLIEVMVGITIGLFIIIGALLMITSMTDSNRQLLVETRLIQDLRAASDLVARDLRRAGYWATATTGVYVVGGTVAPALNSYRNFTPAGCDTAGTEAASPTNGTAISSICYYVEQGTPDNTTSNSEKFGFALTSGGVINAFIAGTTPQPLTDPQSLVVDIFRITPMSQSIDMSSVCATTPTSNPPTVVVRLFDIDIRGFAPSDPTMIRGIQTRVKVRNDAISGACP